MADYLPPVVAKLTGDDSSLARTLTGAKEKIRRFAEEAGRTRATIKVDVKLRDGALAEIRRRINDGPAARLKVDLQLGAAQREELRRSLETRPVQVTVKPVLDDSARRLVEVALDHLTRARTVSIIADADTRTAADDLALLTRARQARVTADADTRVAADDLALLTRPRTATIRTRVIGPTGGGSGGGERDAVDGMRALVSLAPALVPVAAEAAAVAAQVAGATLAVGAFGLAVIPQIKSLSAVTDAQTKYTAAVSKYGAGSTQAVQAQAQYAQALAAMPPATQQAAGALMVLKSGFKSWSDGLSKFTMAPVARSMAVVQAILPKLNPMVREASTDFGRLVTVAGGAVASPGFNAFAKRVTDFANRALKGATDGAIHLIRVLSEGNSSGPLAKFMDYVHSNGPAVKDTLHNVAEAVGKIMSAAAQAGPGMLTLVNAVAKLVASLPTSFITRALQLYTAFNLLKLAGSGIGTVAGGVQSLVTRLVALRAASAAAGGGMAGLRAAFASLGTAAKASVIVAGVAALVLVVAKLSSMGQSAVPSVDRLTTSLSNLGRTGQVSGAAAKAYGKDLSGLADSLRMVARPDLDQQIRGTILGLAGIDTSQMKHAKEDIDAVDKSLAGMVKSGHADLAKAALADITKAMVKQGLSGKELDKQLGDYKSALADQALEQKLAAQSMGLFGDQAQQVQQKLDAQKASADGLRQSIQALNDANRTALGGMIGFEGAIDAATQAAKTNAGSLHMHNGELDLNSQKARDAASALSDLASKTEEAAADVKQNNGSWEKAVDIYNRGRSSLISSAKAMGLTSAQAKQLADQILNIKDLKTSRIKLEKADAQRDIEAFNAAVKRTPNAKSVTLQALTKSGEQVLESFGLKVKRLPDGSVTVTTKNGQALSAIANVAAALRNLNGKTATTWTYHNVKTTYSTAGSVSGGKSVHGMVGATGGLLSKLPVKRLAIGGEAQFAPNGLLSGPGTGISDSILALFASGAVGRVSNTEFVVNAASTKKHLRLLEAINDDRLPKLASGGKVSQGMKDARSQLAGGFGISSFGRMAGYQRTPFEHNLAVPADTSALVSSLNELSGQIKKAFSGHTESSLLKHLDSAGKSLIRYETQLNKVTSSLASAKTKLDDLKNSAAQLKSSVASSIMQGVSVVTQAPQEGFALSSNDVVNSMNAQLQKAAAFSAQLQELKKRGLSADLLEQIASAGVDQGGATATALAGASNAQIKQLNSMQSQLKTSANKAGSAVSDAMYGAGIRAAEGLVKGLEKKQKAIEAAMLRIAKSMEAAIRKALKMRSPSQVMVGLGDNTALSYAHGINRSSKHAVIAARGMAMSVHQGAALTGPRWTLAAGGGGGGGAVVNHYHFNFEVQGSVATVDKLAKDVEVAFLRRGMRNPATYPQYKR